jgi:hypothetical protein
MPRTSLLSRLSVENLKRLIDDRERDLKRLLKQRAKLEKQLRAIDRMIATVAGDGVVGQARGMGSGRRRNSETLPAVIARVLEKAGQPMKVGDIAQQVERAGYQSSSANFRGIVNQALVKDKRFISPARGLYSVKIPRKGAASPSALPRERRRRKRAHAG